jgi:SAM-dependent methyltransferase
MAEPVGDSGSSAVSSDTRFDHWLDALEKRHFADLTFPQVSSALRALSSTYVERRQRIREGGALDGAGKRAAFALFYGPLHYLLVREIVRALGEAVAQATPLTDFARGRPLVDLGCGTGAAGAAWGSASSTPPEVIGLDRHPWAVAEAAETYRAFHLSARTRRADIATAALPKGPASIVAAFTLNEMSELGSYDWVINLQNRDPPDSFLKSAAVTYAEVLTHLALYRAFPAIGGVVVLALTIASTPPGEISGGEMDTLTDLSYKILLNIDELRETLAQVADQLSARRN